MVKTIYRYRSVNSSLDGRKVYFDAEEFRFGRRPEFDEMAGHRRCRRILTAVYKIEVPDSSYRDGNCPLEGTAAINWPGAGLRRSARALMTAAEHGVPGCRILEERLR